MSLTTDIQSTIPQLVADLRTAEKRADDKLREATGRAAEKLRVIMQRVSHVKTGQMRASEIVEGPFSIGQGTLEARIGPTVSYAADEAARGGDHDFRQRTLDEGQAVIDDLTKELENAIVEAIIR